MSSSEQHPHVQLGTHPLPVYEQAPMRIIKRLAKLRDAFTGALDDTGEFDPQKFFSGLGTHVYYLFCTFIPNLPERMPEWEFWGYSSRDAYESGDFDPERDGKEAATFTQWLDAFDVIVEVHGGKRFMDMLGGVFDPKLLRAEMSLALSEWRESIGSPSSPGRNGTSPPLNSGTTAPGSAELGGEEQESASASPTANSSGIPQPTTA